MTITLDFSLESDINPFVFSAGVTAIIDQFKIVSGSLRPKYAAGDTSIAVVDSPPTSGLLEVSATILGVNGDAVLLYFGTALGTGFCALLAFDTVRIKAVTAGVVSGGSSIASAGGITYVNGDAYHATCDLATGDLKVYNQAAPSTVIVEAPGLTLPVGMTCGFGGIWGDVNAAGVTSVSLSDAAAGATIDSINSGSPVRFGQTVSIATTDLGTLTSVTIGGISATAISATDGDGTITIPTPVSGSPFTPVGTVNAVAGDGTDTADLDISLDTFEDYDTQAITGTIDTSGWGLSRAVTDLTSTDVVHYPIADGQSIDNTGALSDWPDGNYTLWLYRADGDMYSFSIAINLNGIAVSTAIKRLGIFLGNGL